MEDVLKIKSSSYTIWKQPLESQKEANDFLCNKLIYYMLLNSSFCVIHFEYYLISMGEIPLFASSGPTSVGAQNLPSFEFYDSALTIA
ncbi:hypothetical protein H5410_040543 [Solanum commersonii]|uniref:Uncharacterized protein n=1 Tax=Solanum commersonii TaxID=4109 RepID=A0A9J5XQE3_SOLCO|nr:hypothetical protein H5410_040543 [Solanum commersonii]